MSDWNCKLVCTGCGAEYDASKAAVRCDKCGETLEIPFDGRGEIRKEEPFGGTLFERYREFFPYFERNDALNMGEGFTPLLSMPRLSEETGAGEILIKNESVNPTWSFKDRGSSAGIRRALQLGYQKVGTLSTGNMAISMAAFANRAGLKAFILVNDHIDEEKLNPIAVYDPCLIKVEGDYARLYDESLSIGERHGIYFVNSDEPFRIEGYRTLSFEVCEQLNFEVPDYVIVPTSAGGHFRGILKGFLDFKKAGLISKIPVMVCAQTVGCATINNAYEKGLDKIVRTQNPDTIAHSIENAFPPSGNAVLRCLKEYGGKTVSVTDEELLEAQRTLCRNGLFVQPGSAASYAAVRKMGRQGMLKGNERIVCVTTSTGLKYTSILSRHKLVCYNTKLEELDDFIAGL